MHFTIVVSKPFDDEDLVRDSLIQRFEFCYELAWKTLKEYLQYNGLIVASMPRAVFTEAYQNSIINNEEIWLSMIKDRNVSSHEYKEDYILTVATRIKEQYFNEFNCLLQNLENEVKKLEG